jgi:hypothetical protein
MEHVLSSVVVWQSVAPIFLCAVALLMMKGLSAHWSQQTALRTARVVSRLPSRRSAGVRR